MPSGITWRFTSSSTQQQTTLTPGARHIFSDDHLTLTITNLTYTDAGQYLISTTNRNGADTASLTLTIEGKSWFL